jgi:hypothetical protein
MPTDRIDQVEGTLGVLTDYLRAPDAETVVRAMEEETKQDMFFSGLLGDQLTDEELEELSQSEGLDALGRIDAKGMGSIGLLPELIAVIKRVPVSLELVKETWVWPTTPPSEPERRAEDDPWVTGPWVTQFDADIRDTLAGVDDAELPDIAARWGRTFGVEPEALLLDTVEHLVRFAREARSNDEQLYCWISL